MVYTGSLKDLDFAVCSHQEEPIVRTESEGRHWSFEVEVGDDYALREVNEEGKAITVDSHEGSLVGRKLHSGDV